MVGLSVVNAVKSVMPRTPVPTPIAAVSSGRPAVSSEPKVIVRTISATTIPISSDAPPALAFSSPAAPPNSTSTPGLFDRREGVLQAFALARLDHVPFVFELDLGERVAAVLGDRALRFERVGDRDDAGRLARGRDGAFDRRRVVFHLTAARGGEDDLAGGAAGGGELRFQQVDRLLGAGAGDLEFFREGLRDGAADDREDDESTEPEGENAASATE